MTFLLSSTSSLRKLPNVLLWIVFSLILLIRLVLSLWETQCKRDPCSIKSQWTFFFCRKAILPLLGLEENTRSYRAPVVGDHVISHHNKWAFFGATIACFNRETMTYTVNWDDGDPTDRVQSYRVQKIFFSHIFPSFAFGYCSTLCSLNFSRTLRSLKVSSCDF